MPTRRLQFDNPPVTKLKTSKQLVEIEVPKGESHFQIIPNAQSVDQEFIFHLRHPHSRLLLTGLVKAAGESSPHLKTRVIHHTPETKAETVIKTLAYDSSQPHYEGLITIEKQAQNCESYLNHHSLLLGSKAKSWTLPSLEIEANQVKCSHAATLRTITDLDLFYLRSRGLDPEDSKQIMIEAFIADVV